MNKYLRVAVMCAPVVLAAPAAVRGQTTMLPAPGYATVNIAGLGNQTTIAGESRIPILSRNLSWDASSGLLHIRATGTRGAVRQLDIDLRSPRTGARFELGRDSNASIRVRLEEGAEITADSGRGYITITAFDDQHVIGTYEGTFSHGQVPVVIRGRFEANLTRARPGGAAPAQ